MEKGEKNTKYFLGLEKRNSIRKSVFKLKTQNGKELTDESDILEEQVTFYKALYCEEPHTLPFEKFIELPFLSQNQCESCEGNITEDECIHVLRKMKRNKSPGYDGFTVEFYYFCWPVISKYVLASFNESFKSGHLSVSQRRGIITLLHKKNEPELLKNWRPISLLCVDYKLLTQVLAERLKNVIPHVHG